MCGHGTLTVVSLPYNIKHIEVTVTVTVSYRNKKLEGIKNGLMSSSRKNFMWHLVVHHGSSLL